MADTTLDTNNLSLVTGDYVEPLQDPQNTEFVSAVDSPELRQENKAVVSSFAKDADVYAMEQQFQEGYVARDQLEDDEFRTTDYDVDDLIAAQFRQNNAVYNMIRHVEMQFSTENRNYDESFNPIQEAQKFMDVFGDIEQQEYLYGANNRENFQARLQRLSQDEKDFEIMSHFGDYSNLMTGFLSAAVDIDILIPGIQSYKLAKTSSKTARLLNRLQNAAKGAGSGIAANAATGLVLAETNPSYTKGDMIADLVLGGALGGLIGGLSKGDYDPRYIKRDADGDIDVKDLDNYHQSVKNTVDAFEGQTIHSKVEGPFVTPEDGILRSFNNPVLRSGVDPTSIKALSDVGIAGIKKLSRVAADRVSKMTPEAQDFLTPKKTSDTNYSKFIEDIKARVESRVLTQDPDEVLPQGDLKPSEGVVKAPEGDSTIKTPKEPVGMSEAALNDINTTLKTIHGKGLPEVNDIITKGDEVLEVSFTYPDGRTTKYLDDEAAYMADVIRSQTLIDTSAALNKAERKHFIEAQKRYENELKEIHDLGTDFAEGLKQKDSLVLRDFMLKITSSATGNNALTGLNAATIKNGVRNYLQQPFSVYQSALKLRGEELMTLDPEKTMLRHNRYYTADKRPFNRAAREVSELISDINLAKSQRDIELGAELENLMNTYVDRARLIDNREFNDAVKAIASKYKINKHVLTAAVGQNMVAWRSIDSMKTPPVEDINAGPVRGTESLERSFYQPQKASSDIIQDMKRSGYDIEEIRKVFYEGYYNGIQLKNPEMDLDDVEAIAKLHANSITGRYWEVGKTKAGDASDFTKFTEEIDNYIRSNVNLDDAVKEDLYQLKQSLEVDAATPSFLKTVTPFDRTVEVPVYNKLTGETSKMKAGDVMTPVDSDTWTMYINRVAGEVSLASKGIKGREELSTIRKLIKNEMNATGKYAPEQVDSKLELFDAIKSQMLSEPNPNIDNTSAPVFWFRAMKRALNLAVLNKLFVPQLAETAVVLSGLPIKRSLDYMGFAALSQQKKAVLRNNFRTLEEISVNFEVLEHFNSPQMGYVEEFGHSSARQKVMHVLDVGEQAQRRMFFMNNVMNFQRKVAWLGTMESTIIKANKSDWKLTKRMANQGMTQEVLDIIKREVDSNRIILDKDGIVLNYDGYDISNTIGRDGLIKLSGVLQTIQDSEKILRPPVGQSNKALQQPFISALTTLKSYPLHSFNSLLLRHWEYKDASTAGLVASTAIISYAAAYLKMAIEGKDTDELKMVEGMMKYNSLGGTLGMMIDATGKTLDIDALKMSPDYGRNATFSLPVVDYMNNVSQIPRVMLNAAGGNMTAADMSVVNGVAGFITQNPFTAALSNNLRDNLRESERVQRLEARRAKRAEEKAAKEQEAAAQVEQPLEQQAQTPEAEALQVLETF